MMDNLILDNRIKIFLDKDIEFSPLSKSKINNLLSLDDISQVVILPDIHSKPDNPFPTGIVTFTSNTLYPFLIGQEIGCGMRVIKTSLRKEDIDSNFLDNYFKHLENYLRDNKKRHLYSLRMNILIFCLMAIIG
ncbi:MAG: RtcB family protein [Candidatus Omnitrophica bacterium]|nr:RtcB family protein [Candidatus Omnitrophota bacterium]